MTRVARSKEDLEAALAEQLAFLEASADAFDRGFASEAKRLAVTIRVLVHDTRRSTSLLTELGLKTRQFYDSAIDLQPGNLLTHSGLVFMAVKRGATRFVAMLDEMPMTSWKPFDAWWEKPVFVDDHRQIMTRRQLVLAMANQDGGAHIDSTLDEVYHRLTRENSTAWYETEGESQRPLTDPAGPSVRQIAHEMLKSLRTDYAKAIKHDADMVVGGAAAMNLSAAPPASTVPLGRTFPGTGRNEPCPCGSGRKYKRCHGKPSR